MLSTVQFNWSNESLSEAIRPYRLKVKEEEESGLKHFSLVCNFSAFYIYWNKICLFIWHILYIRRSWQSVGSQGATWGSMCSRTLRHMDREPGHWTANPAVSGQPSLATEAKNEYHLFHFENKIIVCFCFSPAPEEHIAVTVVWAQSGGQLFVWTVNHHRAVNGRSVVWGESRRVISPCRTYSDTRLMRVWWKHMPHTWQWYCTIITGTMS